MTPSPDDHPGHRIGRAWMEARARTITLLTSEPHKEALDALAARRIGEEIQRRIRETREKSE